MSLAPPAGHEPELLLKRRLACGRGLPHGGCPLIGAFRRVRSWETASVSGTSQQLFQGPSLTPPVRRRSLPRRRVWTTSTATTEAGASQVRRANARLASRCSSAAESSSRLRRAPGAADVHAREVQEEPPAAAGGQPAVPPRPQAVRSDPALGRTSATSAPVRNRGCWVAAPAKDIEAAFQGDGEKLQASSSRFHDANLSPWPCSLACPPGGPAALQVGPRPSNVPDASVVSPKINVLVRSDVVAAGGQRRRPVSNKQPHLDWKQQHAGVVGHRGGAAGTRPGAGAAKPGRGTWPMFSPQERE